MKNDRITNEQINAELSRYTCSICGAERVKNCPTLYGYNTRYECCFNCYKRFGTVLNRDILEAVEKGISYEQNS